MSKLAVDFGSKIPASWAVAAIQDVAEMSPKLEASGLDDDRPVHFVPMSAVAEDFGGLDASQLRPLQEVRKGYTYFSEGDVLFAKITPCMENGKGAIAPNLQHDHAFGSTELHVLRPGGAIGNKWLAFYLSQPDFRRIARHNMTGTAGQLRVPSKWLGSVGVPVPPRAEQDRIVEKLEELLSDLDAGVAELKAAQRKLAQYRQSLLKAAVEGTLTADWRATHGTPQESGTDLLQRILTERRARWEQKQLARFAEQGKTPPKGWQTKYPEPVAPDLTDLPLLPEGWTWASIDQLATSVRNGLSQRPEQEPVGYPILRINAVRAMSVNLDEVRYLPISESEAENYILNDGDLLATRYNGSVDLLGVVGVVRGLSRETVHPDKLIRIQPVLDEYLADWIEAAASTGSSRAHVVSRVKTTAGQTGISGDDLKRMPIPLPSMEEQQAILERLGSGLSAHKQQESAIDYVLKQAAAQRKNLLKAAFAGQLVPQDPADEPASALLARIRAAREQSPAPRGRRRAGSNPAPATNSPTPTRRGRKAKERA